MKREFVCKPETYWDAAAYCQNKNMVVASYSAVFASVQQTGSDGVPL